MADLALPAHELLLGASKLRCRCILCVALNGVRELGRSANEVQRVHAHGVAARLHGAAALAGRLQHAELRL